MVPFVPKGYQALEVCFHEWGRTKYDTNWDNHQILRSDFEMAGVETYEGEDVLIAQILERDHDGDPAFLGLQKKVSALRPMRDAVWYDFRNAFVSEALEARSFFMGKDSLIPSVEWAHSIYERPIFSRHFGMEVSPYLIHEKTFREWLEGGGVRIRTTKSPENDISVLYGKNKGGRPTKYDWLAIHVQIALSLFDQNAPKSQAELQRRILEWYPSYLEGSGQEYKARQISETELKRSTSAFWEALKDPKP